MLISKTDESGFIKVDLPHEPGEWVKVVPMTADVFEDALADKESVDRQSINDFDKDLAVEMLRTAPDADDTAQEKARARRREKRARPAYEDLKRKTILEGCVVAWSYTEDVSDENIAKLDNRTADVVGRAIYAASVEPEDAPGNA